MFISLPKELKRNFNPGMIAYAAHRLTGIGLTIYLFLHIYSLSTALISGEAFDKLMKIYASSLFQFGEFVLLVTVVIHTINGVRIVITDLFKLTRQHEQILYVSMSVSALFLMLSFIYFFPNLF